MNNVVDGTSRRRPRRGRAARRGAPAPAPRAGGPARASGRARARSPRASTARPRSRSAARGSAAPARGARRAPRRTPWRRSDSSASSNGSAASRSAKRSPSSPSSSAPTVWFSETDACAAPSASSTCWIGSPVASASSSFVASRPSSTSSRRAARDQLLLPLDDVHRHADRARVVRDGALHRLADPPGRVGGELEAAAPVELLDRAVQAQRPLLDQVEERHAQAAVALCDRDDEPEIRLDHPALRGRVAALDAPSRA